MSQATFVLQTAQDGQFYFTLRAANNEVILTSELYRAAASARQGIESVRVHASNDDNYVRLDSNAGQPYFVLRAANHEVIGVSEMYASRQMRGRGVEAVKRVAGEAGVRVG